MQTFGLFEAKQKFCELIKRASAGERIGITRRGKLCAVIVSARSDIGVENVFDEIERLRKRARRLRRFTSKPLIEEG
jgi:prevent-host-death family protein